MGFVKILGRMIGVIVAVAIVTAVPTLISQLLITWLGKNVIVCLVGIAVVVVAGLYAMYLNVRYLIVQYYEPFFPKQTRG